MEEKQVGFMLVVSVGGWFAICVMLKLGMRTDCEETWETEEDMGFL